MWAVVHHFMGAESTRQTVTASLSLAQFPWWFELSRLTCPFSHVQDIQICTEYLFIDHTTDAVRCAARIICECTFCCTNYLLTGFSQNPANKFLQGLLGLGICRESLLQHLSLLNDDGIINFKSNHKKCAISATIH